MDRQTRPLKKISSLTVPIHWPPSMCPLLPHCIAVTWHPKTSDLWNRGHRNVIAETTGISRLLLNFFPTPPLLQSSRHSGRPSCTSCGRGSIVNRKFSSYLNSAEGLANLTVSLAQPLGICGDQDFTRLHCKNKVHQRLHWLGQTGPPGLQAWSVLE